MNKENWDIIRNSLNKDLARTPPWVQKLLDCEFSEINALPFYDGGSTEEVYRPTCDTKKLEPDYLDFLEQQIRLNARGEEWTNVLHKRLKALKPYVGKEIMTFTFYGHSESVALKMNPENNELIYIE